MAQLGVSVGTKNLQSDGSSEIDLELLSLYHNSGYLYAKAFN